MMLIAILVTATAGLLLVAWLVKRRMDWLKSRPIRGTNPEGGFIFDTVPDFDFEEPLNWFVRIADKAGQEFHNSRTEKTGHYPGVQQARGTAHFREWMNAMCYVQKNDEIQDWSKLKRHIDNLSYKQKFFLYSGPILNLAHMFRMGSPELPVPRGDSPECMPASVGLDNLRKAQFYLAEVLKVPHSYTLFTWIWANWSHKKLKPGTKFTNKDILNYDDITLRFRFFPGMGTEDAFWKVWFYTEANAARIYPLITSAIDACRKNDGKKAKAALMKMEPEITKCFSVFGDFIRYEGKPGRHVRVDHWQDIQGCLHWHDEITPGISGYQIPMFLCLDKFFMVPLPKQIRQTKQKNTVSQPFHVQRFLTRMELQRMSVFRFVKKADDKDIKKTFSNILRKLMIFRSAHLNKCRPYLRRETTTARNFHTSAGGSASKDKAEEMGQDFSGAVNEHGKAAMMSDDDGPFAQEMNQLIKATKGCKSFDSGGLANMLSVGAITSNDDVQYQDHDEVHKSKNRKVNRFSVAQVASRNQMLNLQNTWSPKTQKVKLKKRISAVLL